MASHGRKNVRGRTGVRFKEPYTKSKEKAKIRNLSSELIIYGKIKVGHVIGKKVQRNVERLVTLAKRGDLHSRRLAAARLRDGIKTNDGVKALDVLFNELGPRFKDRNGGYTRLLKLGNRRGDNAPIVLLEFVE
ncbi:MAG TPA: 50S ribosomal protein L17 [Bacilli bacterium]|nr:50S ribosomal protein L17 [Bacilli bacterium]